MPTGQAGPGWVLVTVARIPVAARLMSLLTAKFSAFSAVTQRLAEPIAPFQTRLFCNRAALFMSIAAITVCAVPTCCPAAWNADCAALMVWRLASRPATTSPLDLKSVWLLRVAPCAFGLEVTGRSGA